MTPVFADTTEIATDTSTLRHYLVGSVATGSQFERAPSIQAMPERVIDALPPMMPVHLHQLAVVPLPASYAAQTLYVPAESPYSCVRSEAAEDDPILNEWFVDVINRLEELYDLPSDWDHHGAPPIDSADLALALSTLATLMAPATPAPAIVPISGGGIQMEWHRAGLDVEIVVGLGDEDGLYVHDIASGADWEGPTVEGFAELDIAQRLIG